MKILQVSNRVPWPLNEGGTIGIYAFTRAFSALGHDVSFYCLDGYKHNTPIKEATEELSKYSKLLIHPIDTDVKWDEALIHILKNKSYNVSRFYNTVFEQELISLLSQNTFDVVQLEGTFVGPYINSIRKHHAGLLAMRMHNVEYEIWERLAANESNPLKSKYLNILARQLKEYEASIIPKVDCIIPVTDDDGQKFRTLHPTRNYFTVPAGIDLDRWSYSPSSTFTKWYHIGSMEWHANREAVEWFIEDIHPLILAENAEYQLSIAGKGIDKSSFPSTKIDVKSFVPDATMYVKQQDVCIVPLKSGSGIRLKILEAMAAGKLVISTTVGAQGIEYENGKHLLIADKPEEFRDIYTKLKSKEIDGQTIIQEARKLIEDKYSTTALAEGQLKYYRDLISS